MRPAPAIVFALLLPVAAAAQPSSTAPAAVPRPLQLEEALRLGETTSHRLAEASARSDAARALVGQRQADTLPQFAALAGYTRTNHVTPFNVIQPGPQLFAIYPDVPDNYRTRLDAQWPIYTAGRLDALERAARAEATAAGDDLRTARADLRLEVTRAYWALVTSIEAVRVVDESVTRMEAHLRDVRNQLDQGLIPPNDVLSVEAQLSRQRMLAIQARSTRDVAEADLDRLIGAAPGTPIQPASALDVPEPGAAAIETLVDQALRQRSERAALVERASAAGERRDAAAAGSKPTVAVAGGVDYANPNPRIFPRQAVWNESWDASVNVSWSLFDGGRTRAQVAEAAASARVANERLADFDQSVAVEVRQRVSELTASRAAIDAAADAVRSAVEARRVVGQRFSAGVATSTDVLDAQVALLQAELDRTQALANTHLAEARLARALGR